MPEHRWAEVAATLTADRRSWFLDAGTHPATAPVAAHRRLLVVRSCYLALRRLADQALVVEREIGLLLPCNVEVRRDGDRTVVQALDPHVMVSLPGRPELQPVTDEAAKRLNAALQTVAGA